ncbi:TolC family protein [Thalassospira sp. TSL5-1]|uniref:TolC family protein n=1 Tax=Thalassospira sp. TSL5-1 TaxID=1544451 RepID=UPI000938920B|nr:TolC family protein [Thalassospira sp. TSL5-1]
MVPVAAMGMLVLAGCAVTPEPLTQAENDSRVQTDLNRLFANQEKIDGPLTLDDAIARALKYNLDHRLKLMEEAVSMGQLDVANVNLLPDVVAKTGWTTRNNRDSTYNEQKTSTSVSSDRSIRKTDLSVSWNVLDFAIGYMRAHQQADLALIVSERRRQVIHSVVNQTRGAYWRAVAADRALKSFDQVLERVRGSLGRSQKQVDEGIGGQLEALSYQEDLLVTLRELEARRRQLVEARTELAVLMNIHPDSEFTLVDSTTEAHSLPAIAMSSDQLELEALHNRSELRSEAYQLRINQRDSKIALIQMVPGLNFSAGINHTTDSYKVNSRWYDGALNLSWNLMQVFKAPANMKLADSQIELSKVRSLALSMAVISQVNIAQLRFNHALDDFKLADQISSVQDRIVKSMQAQRSANTVGESDAIRAEVRSLLSGLQRDMAYADLQAAYGQVFASIGVDPLPRDVADDSVDSIAQAIHTVMNQWQNGEYDASGIAVADDVQQQPAEQQTVMTGTDKQAMQ